MAETFTFDLGSERNVKIYEHNTTVEETIIDVRLFDDDEPTEKGKKTLYLTREGVSLRIPEWANLKNSLSEINFHLPVGLDSVAPCYARQGHSNQMAMLECMECNQSGDIDNDN
uniref:Uncharacterized protein n=1 Tax=Magallana gigas TaxID=29159 RepID=A0A8W8HKZ7_MAGGI